MRVIVLLRVVVVVETGLVVSEVLVTGIVVHVMMLVDEPLAEDVESVEVEVVFRSCKRGEDTRSCCSRGRARRVLNG